MVNRTLIILLALMLLIIQVRATRLSHSLDRAFAQINTQSLVINQQTDALADLHRNQVFLRTKIAGLVADLTRKGLLEPAPPEDTQL